MKLPQIKCMLMTFAVLTAFSANAILAAEGDTVFIAFDLTDVTIEITANSPSPDENDPTYVRGVGPSPFIVWHDAITYLYRTRIMTLDALTGIRLGSHLDFSLPSPELCRN